MQKCREKIAPTLLCKQYTGDNYPEMFEFLTGCKYIDGFSSHHITKKNDKIIILLHKQSINSIKRRVIKINDWVIEYNDLRGNIIIIVTEKQFKKHYEVL
jgi:hypothetical protein